MSPIHSIFISSAHLLAVVQTSEAAVLLAVIARKTNEPDGNGKIRGSFIDARHGLVRGAVVHKHHTLEPDLFRACGNAVQELIDKLLFIIKRRHHDHLIVGLWCFLHIHNVFALKSYKEQGGTIRIRALVF